MQIIQFLCKYAKSDAKNNAAFRPNDNMAASGRLSTYFLCNYAKSPQLCHLWDG